MEPNFAVADFLIAHARSRAEIYPDVAPLNCSEGVAIFDELDSLPAEEFALIYALYLLGSGAERNPELATKEALTASFAPLESMASDTNLHVVLTQGLEQWQQHFVRS